MLTSSLTHSMSTHLTPGNSLGLGDKASPGTVSTLRGDRPSPRKVNSGS